MLNALHLSIAQLRDPAIVRVLAKSIGLTALIFALLGAGLVFGTKAIMTSYGWGGPAGFAAATAAAIAALIGAWLLFRVVAIAVIGLFADDVVTAVEARHYPDAAGRARPVRLARSLRMGARSIVRALAFNLLALPLYFVLLATGVGTPLLFLAVNALLLGRDLGEMVAARHVPKDDMAGWLAATRGPRAVVGLIAAGMFVIPVVNLLAPVIGAALATHRFHGGRT